ncbi:MAG: TadE/TadG family type IV pilus assembly protein [Nitrospirales bacterium]
MRKGLRSESGASAVEFALLLPVLVLILFGIIELGLALYQQSILTNASREGARLGIVQSVPPITTAAITTRVDTYLTSAGITPGTVTKAITLGTVTGTPVTVTLTLPYTFVTLPGVTGMFGPAMSSALTLRAVTVMRHE